jgi:hypothetical protein
LEDIDNRIHTQGRMDRDLRGSYRVLVDPKRAAGSGTPGRVHAIGYPGNGAQFDYAGGGRQLSDQR